MARHDLGVIEIERELMKSALKRAQTKLVFTRPDGYDWNPLTAFPRNNPCFCGSKTKFKRCCFPYVGHLVENGIAQRIRVMWDEIISGRLTFPGYAKKFRGEKK